MTRGPRSDREAAFEAPACFIFPEELRGSEVSSGGVLFNTPHGVYSFNIKLWYGAKRSEASVSYPAWLLCGVNTKHTLQRAALFFTFLSRVISFFALPKNLCQPLNLILVND